MWELFFCVALSSQINIELFFQKKVPVPGKNRKPERNEANITISETGERKRKNTKYSSKKEIAYLAETTGWMSVRIRSIEY